MKNVLLVLSLMGAISAYAGVDKIVKIEVVGETLELCKTTSDAIFVKNDVEGELMDSDLRVAEISSCNKMLNGKYKKVVKFYKIK